MDSKIIKLSSLINSKILWIALFTKLRSGSLFWFLNGVGTAIINTSDFSGFNEAFNFLFEVTFSK